MDWMDGLKTSNNRKISGGYIDRGTEERIQEIVAK